MSRVRRQPAFTLLEVLLVIGILAVLAGLVMPRLFEGYERRRLESSAQSMRALLQMTRANAMIDGMRYRIRFPREDEIDGTGGSEQPLVEIERDPLDHPEEFDRVRASWAEEATLAADIRCVKVRLGKPTVEVLLGEVDEEQQQLDQMQEQAKQKQSKEEKFDKDFPPLLFEADGTSDWATFVLTDAPADVKYEDLDPKEHNSIDVILDGTSGLAWLQRSLYVDELEMMKEHGWPPVLRRDFLTPVALTEDDVLEIRERAIRQ